jgi:large subunit ribosomal protein L22
MNTNLEQKTAKAVAKYIRMSPTKVQRVLNQIRGCFYDEALIILRFMPYRACKVVSKVLKSAASNAQKNYGLKKQDLQISTAFVNKGPTLKRIRPRAKGRAFPIKKYTSHITIIVTPTS